MSTNTLNEQTTSDIADKFYEVLKDWLTEQEFADMKRLNETAEYAGPVCASHDYCDANMAMHEAFIAVTGSEPNVVGEGPEVEAACKLWNEAWELARERHIGKPLTALGAVENVGSMMAAPTSTIADILDQPCTYPACNCIVLTSTTQPEPMCPKGIGR